MRDPRIIAVDWSGDASTGAARKIWLAEVVDGRVARLESGRDREAMARHLADLAREDPNVVVGVDFAFSFPSWFLEHLGLGDAAALWRLVASEGERWLRECAFPFWGRPGKGRPELRESFRRTERKVGSVSGISPKSVFQIGGAGAVGTGSIRGMPMLARLQEAGYAIWPFDVPRLPMVVEIYPRVLTGPVTKSATGAREEYLRRYPTLGDDVRRSAIGSEDAFDALVSALVMSQHREGLLALDRSWRADDPPARLEGEIWTVRKVPSFSSEDDRFGIMTKQASAAELRAVRAGYVALRGAIEALPETSPARGELVPALARVWETLASLEARIPDPGREALPPPVAQVVLG